MKRSLVHLLSLAVLGAFTVPVQAEVKLSAIFTPHMVLQRDMECPVWGKADPGEKVTVTIAGQTASAETDASGKWHVKLSPLKAGGPHTLVIKGKNEITLDDVLVGEVWLCSGQSNMQWSVAQANDPDLEIATAKYPKIRLVTVPNVGSQESLDNFVGQWDVCSPETVGQFSAVGYFFGRQLHTTLDVPVGLIDNAWGGSACEAWVKRDLLAKDEKYSELMKRWTTIETNFDPVKADEQHKVAMAKWQTEADAAKKAGKPLPRQPQHPANVLKGNARPGNLYGGCLKPVLGYGIRGAIWYQGESNASRAYQYRDLFPLMIQSWRDEWAQGDFPFYWVQLADFLAEKTEPVDSNWAELREAQTMTMSRLKNTGEAVIIDLGESNDIHPRNKQDVAKRLARWALAKDYGVQIAHQSPTYKSSEIKDGKMVLTFDHVGTGLKNHDFHDVRGFSIAGDDKKFVWATAQITAPNQITVSHASVKEPKSVRYGWADNPVCNVRAKDSLLPLTPFRTDDWPGMTVEAK
ncbi:MAG: sialate O-acetylesterase [Planctomycetaceae bacterium]|nr:sialate O-acetylesterase [Planctomycetaceae bacterium]